MNKEKLFLVTIFLWVSLFVQGQVSIDFTKKLESAINGQDVTEKAVNGSVVIVRQSYQVKNQKTGKVYGRNGRKNFGHSYSIGVKTEAGLVLTDGALKPWLYDVAYKKLGDDFEAVISLTEVRDINTDSLTTFNQCPLQMGRQQPEGLWVANAGDVSPNSMEIDQEEGEKEGWLIWFVAKKDLDAKPEPEITIQSVNKKINAKAGSEDLDVNIPIGSNLVLGGIYVCPAYLGGGHVAYRLVGVTVKEEKHWKLRTPFMDYFFEKSSTNQQQDEPVAVEEEQEQEQEVELTPINQDKKKKKK